jgi:hypothetical protein
MPLIHVLHQTTGDGVASLLQRVCREVSVEADIPPDKVWAFWHHIDASMACRPDWKGDFRGGPVVRIFCRRSHSRDRVQAIVAAVRSSLAEGLDCEILTVFVQVIRVDDEEVFNVC